jgi:LDH2 family malate/lactate/ureidoglycolate dehydrogenase
MAQRTFGQWWDHAEDRVQASLAGIARIGRAAYVSVGASPEDAAFLLDVNLDKALQGDHARGLGKVPGIIAAARAGKLDMAPEIAVVRERGATALLDGGPTANGRLVCKRAMETAVERARDHGVGFVGARTSGGILTPDARIAGDGGCVGIVAVQSVPTAAPLGGYRPLLGNGPIAIGVPAGRHDPVILDMSFTQSSASGMLLAAEQGEQVAPGLLLDDRGYPTTDSTVFPDPAVVATGGIGVRGTLTPLGGGHKGYAMLFIVGLLACVLTDTSPPWELFYDLPVRGRYGTLLVAVDPSAFDPGDVTGKVDGFIDTVTGAPRRDGVDEILYPGQRSQQLRRDRREAGVVELPASHFEAFRTLAAEIGEAPPEGTPLTSAQEPAR